MLAAGPCDAQAPPADARVAPTPAAELPPLVFDDLRYAAADWTSPEDRPVAERSVFGRAPWCLSLACPDTLSVRAWYQYLWRETGFANADPLARIEADTAGTGTLRFAVLAGEHPSTWPLQLASGFTARTGVWAARADFSTLPSQDAVRMMQSFWTMAPNETVKPPDDGRYRGAARGRTEVDFEVNNWFGHAGDLEVYLGTGSFPNTERGVNAPLRAAPGARDYTCRIRDGEGERRADPATCAAFLTRDGVWTTMLFRTDGRSMRFEVRADGGGATLRAASDEIYGDAPTQRMMTLMSQYTLPPDDAADRWRIDRDVRVAFDWVYYAAPPDRSFDAVLSDVAAVRAARVEGRRVERLRTAPLRLSRPVRQSPARASVPGYVPPPRLDGPRVRRARQRATYTVRLDDRLGTYRIAWSTRPVDPSGTVGAWSRPDTRAGYRFTTRIPRGAACLDLRAEILEMLYTVVETDDGEAVEWVPHDAPPEVARRRMCRPDTAPAVQRTTP